MKFEAVMESFKLGKCTIYRKIDSEYKLSFNSKKEFCFQNKNNDFKFLTKDDIFADDWIIITKDMRYYALLYKNGEYELSKETFKTIQEAKDFYKDKYDIKRLITNVPDLVDGD